MKSHHWAALGTLAFAVLAIAAPAVGAAGSAAPALNPPVALSAYWSPRIQQWASLIEQAAASRGLDPDFLASLVWMESRGDAAAIGPVGSVGLMQVMPKETGFTWRPTTAELKNPNTNLFWGTRTLATIIKQGRGDIFNALAAYNGGWEQITYRAPKYFATTILRDYVNAVALRRGLSSDEHWIAMFAVRGIAGGNEIGGPIWIADSTRADVYNFGDVNWVPEGYLLIPHATPPLAIVAHCEEAEGVVYDVGVWFYLPATDQWVAP